MSGTGGTGRMRLRAIGEQRGVIVILVPGVVGAIVIARTLMVYWGKDLLAGSIVLAIAVAFLLGLAELLVRQLRVQRLERELRSLPSRPTEGTIDSASPALSALLRARLEQAPLPGAAAGESIAPFLTGLLVMLGLLGTLLGLFQTVHGAGHALTMSADIDALRRSLSAPIDGLTRSFGCSAAGISASAMLGLAVALARRREVRMLRAVVAYASGPLRSLSPVARQTRALELLASQGAALPVAAQALENVGQKLSDLSTQLLSLQEKALSAQRRAFSEHLSSVHGEFAKAAGETGQALAAHVAPLLERLAADSGTALVAQGKSLSDVARNLGQELERDAAQRREEATAALHAMRDRLDEAERERAAAHARELEAATGLVTRTLADSERREQALTARWEALISRFDAQLEAATASEHERLRSLDAQVDAARTSDATRLAGIDDLRSRVGSELERLASALAEQQELRHERERNHDARAERAIAQLVELTDQRVTSVSSLLSDELSQRAATARVLDERASLSLERVDRSASLLDGAIEQQSRGLQELIARVNTLVPQLADAARAGAASTIQRLGELAEQQATRLSELDAKLLREREEHGRKLADRLATHAGDLEQRVTRTSAAVQEAAAIWQASSAEMQAVAELFASSIERQREASDAWLESLGEIEGAVERAGRDAARDALSDQLASTQEMFAHQLQVQRELFDQLRALRGGGRGMSGESDVSAGE